MNAAKKIRKLIENGTDAEQIAVLTELARIAFFDPRRLLDDDGNPIPLHLLDADTAPPRSRG